MSILDDEEERNFDARLLDRASVLLRDPLSELTRKRQTNLLVVSVVTILVALSLVSVSMSEISLGVAKMSFSNSALIRYGLACLTMYFLVLYGIGLTQDYQIYRRTIRPALGNLADVAEELGNAVDDKQRGLAESAEKFRRYNKLAKQVRDRAKSIAYIELMARNQEEGKKILDAMNKVPPLEDGMSLEEQDANRAAHSELFKQQSASNMRFEEIKKQLDEENQRYKAALQEIEAEVGKPEEVSEFFKRASDFSNEQRLQAVDYLVKTHQRINLARNVVEVVVPAVFGLTALVLVLLHWNPTAQTPTKKDGGPQAALKSKVGWLLSG